MIIVRLKTGDEAALQPQHPIVIGGRTFHVGDISRFILDGMNVGGRDRVENGVDLRELVFTDPETNVQFLVSMTMSEARQLGERLLSRESGLILARGLDDL